MPTWLQNILEEVSANPLLQGALVAMGTFILEDPTTIGSGLLVADGRLDYWVAFAGLWSGIALGDCLLYGTGRLFTPLMLKLKFIRPEHLDKGKNWFDRRFLSAIIVSRFIPGTRVPTYMSAGATGASFRKFLIIVIGATLVWTTLLLTLISRFGDLALRYIEDVRILLLAAAIIIVLIWLSRLYLSRHKGQDSTRAYTTHEFMHPALFYIPVFIYYCCLAARYLSLTLPTATNPRFDTGGFICLSKADILDQIPPDVRNEWVEPYLTLRKESRKTANALVSEALPKLEEAGIDFPLVVKPDSGQRGDGVRKVNTQQELKEYIEEFPAEETILLQQLAQHANEVGIFYYRMPGSERGTIFSITEKQFPEVTGDGSSTIRELINENPRMRRTRKKLFERNAERLDTVLPKQQTVRLVFTGNHKQGAAFRNGMHLYTDELGDTIDQIAQSIPEFHFGRFDIRYESAYSLGAGSNFSIIELNGAGAEAAHIWDPAIGLREAYLTLFEQFKIAFTIGAANRKRGHKPTSVWNLLRAFRNYVRTSSRYPAPR